MRWRTYWTVLPLLVALFVGGCGGGGGGAGGVTVTVTPKTAIVILNGPQQFFAIITGGGTVMVATIASTNGAVRGSNIVTITTTSAHGLSVGQSVTISGVADGSFNGTFTVSSVPSTTTFTYAQTGSDATSGGGSVSAATVKWSVGGVDGGNAQLGTITPATTGSGVPATYTAPAALPPATTVSIVAGNGAVRNNNVVTITTTAAHNLVVGQIVTISGVADTSFNGTFFVQTVPSTTTFTYSQTASNATSGGGTVSSTAVLIKAVSTSDSTKSDTATLSVDSGVQISVSPKTATVGTSETFQFLATVTGSTNTNVTWTVTGGSSNGTISTNGLYTAPAAVPSPAAVTVTAASVLDPNKITTATLTVVVAADPTLTAISPSRAAQGSVFQDVYLTGTNFISTTTVLANTTIIPATPVSTTLMRARLPDCVVSAAGTLNIIAQRQNGTTTPAQTLTVVPVRPAVVGTSPDSGIQGAAAISPPFTVNGGYFGTSATCAPATSPAVTAEFSGNPRPASRVTARQLIDVTIGSADLSTAGLFSVAVRNTAASPPVAVTNLAVQPSPAAPSPVNTLPMPPMGSIAPLPGAVAVNTATGIAVVANRGTDSLTLIDLKTSPPSITGGPIGVGALPTGVAVDNVRNLAVVANSGVTNGINNVSIVNLATAAVTTLSTNINVAPFSVGVNPLTGRAVVTYQSTNNATLIDLTANPPAVLGPVSISTGQSPQVAVEPRLNWAIVTPGGAGTLSIVDLGRMSTNTIATGPSGAVRSNNVVTITTTAPHALVPNEAVLITGVADPSFNGTFTVTDVPSGTTFTYSQSAANATSGGGSVNYALPLATATLSTSVRGIGLDTETETVLLVDPGSSTVTFLSILDQAVNSQLNLEPGATAAAFNSLTDIGVTINSATGVASLVSPRSPTRLATINVGASPKAVAIDPTTNRAVVANEGSNDVTILDLGGIRLLHIAGASPSATLTSTAPVALTLVGNGFVSGSAVRLDGDPTGVTTSFNPALPRQLAATIDPSRLGSPRQYALDVANPGGVLSNATNFTVIQPVDLTSAGCTNPQPRAVAIDPERDLAVATRPNCNDIALVSLSPGPTFGTITKTISVGTNPQGVAVIPRLGKAVVSNRGSNNASIVDLVAGSVCGTCTVTVGTEPLGVAINQDTAIAVVANSASNTISAFSADTGGAATAATVDSRPVAVAIDPVRAVGVIANAAQNNLNLVDLSQATPVVTARFGVQQPTSVVFDPVTGLFVAASSLGNQLLLLNTDTQQESGLRVGINPTALAYNFQSSTMVTVNTVSNTISVIDFIDRRVRAVLSSSLAPHCLNPILVGTGAQQVLQQPPCGADIHPRTNLGAFVDGDNNRLLLMPLPR